MLAARCQPDLFAALASATLARFVAYDLRREHERSAAQAKRTTANRALRLDQQTAQWLGRVDAVLNDFNARLASTGLPGGSTSSAPVPDGLAPALLPGDGLLRALYVLDSIGQPLRSVGGNVAPPALDVASLADRRARLQAPSAGRLAIGQPWAEATGNWLVPVSRAKLDAATPATRHHRVGLASRRRVACGQR
jgi:hypothetical protein